MPWPSCKLKINTCIINVEKRHGNIVNRLIAIKHHTFTSDAHFGAQNDEKKVLTKKKKHTHTEYEEEKEKKEKEEEE